MKPTTLSERKIIVNGVGTIVLEGGPSSRSSAVVFVHGNPGSGQDWASLAQEASAFSRVVALDMPGFGRSDKPADFPYTVDGYAAHLAAVLDALGIDRVHLVLHDFGGPWGLAWMMLRPQQVASVSLINTGVMPGYSWHYMAKIWRTPLIGELSQAIVTRGAFHFSLRHGNPRGLPKAFVDRMYDDYDRGTKRAVLKLYRATSNPDELSRRLIEPLKSLHLPALVIWGACDPYIPVKYAGLQRMAFPSAEMVVLQDSGHWPFADNPQAVSQALIPFLRRQIATTTSSAAA